MQELSFPNSRYLWRAMNLYIALRMVRGITRKVARLLHGFYQDAAIRLAPRSLWSKHCWFSIKKHRIENFLLDKQSAEEWLDPLLIERCRGLGGTSHRV